MTSLDITLLYLLAAVLGVVACRSLKLPPMLGYLVVGVLIGPNALAIAQDSKGIRYLAEFGVVFLMFVIGLEFSLPKLRAMRRHVFGLGLSQVVLTVLITTAASLALALLLPQWWTISWQSALALGGVMAMSSTAIVIKLVAERLELESEHGKRVVGILLFQDLAVVPLLVLIPALGAEPEQLFASLGLAHACAGVRAQFFQCADVSPKWIVLTATDRIPPLADALFLALALWPETACAPCVGMSPHPARRAPITKPA